MPAAPIEVWWIEGAGDDVGSFSEPTPGSPPCPCTRWPRAESGADDARHPPSGDRRAARPSSSTKWTPGSEERPRTP